MSKKWEYFWLGILLAVGLVVRLYKINNPIADWHSWRQADTAAVTRNFVKYGVHPFLPRYDDLSDVSGQGFNLEGYRMVEFPLFNLIHYSLYSLSSIFYPLSLEIWGRMTSVLASLVSAGLLYVLVKRHVGTAQALVSMAVFLLLPFNIYFSRVILPDPLMVTLALAALVVLPSRRWLAYLLAAVAVAVKPPAAFLLLPVLFSWRFAPLVAMPFVLWRLWQWQHPEGVPGSFWLFNGDGIRFKGAFFRWIFADRLGRLILGYWGLWPALTGILENLGQLRWLVGGSLLYLFVFATGNVRHDYYQISIIPAVAVLVGVGIVTLWRQGGWLRRSLTVVAVVFMLAFGWFEIRGNYQINNPAILAAGQAAGRLLPAQAIVIADYNGDTAFLYQTNRRGFPNVPVPIEEMVTRFGVEYYISVNFDDRTRRFMDQYLVVEETPQYVIIKLQ